MALHCIVMAAGRGTRLRSSVSKMLLPLDGKALVAHPVGTALSLRGCEVVVVVGHQRREVEAALTAAYPQRALRFAVQQEQRGTGDAVAAGLRAIKAREGSVIILSGDVPLLSARTIGRLRRLRERKGAALALLSMELDDPGRYGRVVRQGRRLRAVVEYLDAAPAERALREVNAGIYCVELGFLRREIKRLRADNAQGEVYLTDLVATAGAHDRAEVLTCDPREVQGVNTWAELASVAEVLQARKAAALMAAGVHLVAPHRVVIHSSVRVGPDTTLHPGVELTGATRVGAGCVIDAGAILRDCRVGAGARVEPYSVLEGVRVPAGAVVGPPTRSAAVGAAPPRDDHHPDSPTRRGTDKPRRARRRPAKGNRKDQ